VSSAELDYVRTQLLDVYTPEGAEVWLTSRHRLLDGQRPTDLIALGEGERVLTLVAQLQDGAFA
jgi:hypothetical protein